MYKHLTIDQQAFFREASLESAKSNEYLTAGKVLIAETGLFYDVVNANTTGCIPLNNGKFLKHIENITVNGNVLKGAVVVNANQIPQDSSNRFVTDTEKETWNNKANKLIQVIAGNGLTGGGDLTVNRTLNVVANNDSITVTADGIQLNPINDLVNTSTTRALTAAQGKVLEDKKVNRSGDTFTGIVKSNSDVRTTGKVSVDLKTGSVNDTPVVSLAIGAVNTGINAIASNELETKISGTQIQKINGTSVINYKPTYLQDTLNVTGAVALNSTLAVTGKTEVTGEIKTNSTITFGGNKGKIEYNPTSETIEFKFL